MDHRKSSAESFIHRGSQVCGSYNPPMHLSISTTTGCRFELSVPFGETVEGLRRRLSQKLRVSRDRIVLLHKDRQLMEGKLVDQGVADESKLTLVPTIEAGLMSQTPKTEKTMMQALESLTEAQVSDFLSGRSPLTLALGVGAHMMYVQLQLASQSVVGQQQPQTEVRCRSDSREPPGTPDSPARPCHPNATPRSGLDAQLPTSPPSPSPPSNKVPVVCRHPQSSLPASHTPEAPLISHRSSLTASAELPAPSLPSGSAPRCSTLFPTAPFCSSYLTCSSPGPKSPAPAATFPGGEHQTPSAAKQSTEPGAVIESFVNHRPGVFSGTFSGTLPTISQSGISQPRHGITTILQILNDLLSATRHHQRASSSLSQLHCPTPSPPAGPRLTHQPSYKATSEPIMIREPEPKQLTKSIGEGSRSQRSPTEENLTLRSKLERLHFLMHQRRLRRRARRGAHTSHPYPQCHGHLWLPRQQRAARCRSNDSLSIMEGNSPGDLEMEDIKSPWEPELTSDIVVA